MPSTVEERVGGQVLCSFGPGMDSVSTISEWSPPHRFTADSRDDMGPEDPTVATEWIVEAQSGDTCIVRVVHSWFSDKDDWDQQFIGHSYGWRSFFRVLRLYLANFSGQPSAPAQVVGIVSAPKEDAWAKLTTKLGMSAPAVDARIESSGDAPEFTGTVAWAGQPEWPEDLLVVIERPSPGIAHFVAHPMDQTYLTLRFYLYGDQAAGNADQIQSTWQTWVDANISTQPAEAVEVGSE